MKKYELEEIFNVLYDPDRELYENIKKNISTGIRVVIKNNNSNNYQNLLESYFYLISNKTYQKPENILIRENQDKFFLYDDEIYEIKINNRVLYLEGFELLKHTEFYSKQDLVVIKLRVLSRFGQLRKEHEEKNLILNTEAFCMKKIDGLRKEVELEKREGKSNIKSFIAEREKAWKDLAFQYFGCKNVLEFIYFIDNYMYVYSNKALISQRENYTQEYLQRIKNYTFCIEKKMPFFLEGRIYRDETYRLGRLIKKFVENVVFDFDRD